MKLGYKTPTREVKRLLVKNFENTLRAEMVEGEMTGGRGCSFEDWRRKRKCFRGLDFHEELTPL